MTRSEKVWRTKEESLEVVKQHCTSAKDNYDQEQNNTLLNLAKWGKATFRAILNQRKMAQENLIRIQDMAPYENYKQDLLKAAEGVNNMLRLEEIWWSHREKSEWLMEGDKNTKLFHIKATQRKNQNTISKIQNYEESWVKDPMDIVKVFINYFENIYTSNIPHNQNNI